MKENEVTVRWWDGYLEGFKATEVRFGSDLLFLRLSSGENRHIPLRQVRWFSLSIESHQKERTDIEQWKSVPTSTPETPLPAPPEQVTDSDLEDLWRELADVPFDDNDPDVDMTLAEDWRWFRKGTPREEIWHWFDERHSKGVAFLLYGPDGPERQEAPEEAPAPAGGGTSDKRPEGARGLLRLYCRECGNTFGTFLKERQSEITCRCGHHIDLTAPLARYRFTCPYCEKETWGQTNLEDPEITIRCRCGGDVDLRWVPKAKEYQN